MQYKIGHEIQLNKFLKYVLKIGKKYNIMCTIGILSGRLLFKITTKNHLAWGDLSRATPPSTCCQSRVGGCPRQPCWMSGVSGCCIRVWRHKRTYTDSFMNSSSWTPQTIQNYTKDITFYTYNWPFGRWYCLFSIRCKWAWPVHVELWLHFAEMHH